VAAAAPAAAAPAPAAPATTPPPAVGGAAAGANEGSSKPSGGGAVAEDPLKEAERILAQGDVMPACRKAEEARHMNPRSPAVHKFLGKCYMRAGNAKVASDNYRLYLELAPDAPDAAFIRSYVK